MDPLVFETQLAEIMASSMSDATKLACITALEMAGAAAHPASAPAIPPVRTVGGYQVRIDPVYAPGTDGTVTSPVTGHTISKRVPGEGIMALFVRTSLQTGGDPNKQGGIIEAGSALHNQGNFELMVDEYACTGGIAGPAGGLTNPYDSPIEAAYRAKLFTDWAAAEQAMNGRGSLAATQASIAEVMYVENSNVNPWDVLSGTYTEINQALNNAFYSAPVANMAGITPWPTIDPTFKAAVDTAAAARIAAGKAAAGKPG